MSTTLVLLDHPCYGVDVWEAETVEDVEIGRKQGYIPLEELQQMPKRLAQLETFLNCLTSLLEKHGVRVTRFDIEPKPQPLADGRDYAAGCGL